MNIIQALILGIVQGVTELLPISSSGHLAIIPWLFGWINSPEFKITFEAFDVALHFGTLLAIGLFFFKDWLKLIKGGYDVVINKKKSFEGKMFWYIVAATIPGGIIGLLLDKTIGEGIKENYLLIAIALMVMGIILYVVDKNAKAKTKYENMTFKQTFIIGVSQCLAFIPGVSRSGITMTTARGMGIDRKSAAKYSFMLSAPIVLAATILKMKDFAFGSIAFYVGVIASFLVGLIVIKFLLKYLQKGSFKVFAIYRIIFALLIILVSFFRG